MCVEAHAGGWELDAACVAQRWVLQLRPTSSGQSIEELRMGGQGYLFGEIDRRALVL